MGLKAYQKHSREVVARVELNENSHGRQDDERCREEEVPVEGLSPGLSDREGDHGRNILVVADPEQRLKGEANISEEVTDRDAARGPAPSSKGGLARRNGAHVPWARSSAAFAVLRHLCRSGGSRRAQFCS